jgi:hypothetical protein
VKAYAICTFDVSRGYPIFERACVCDRPASQLRAFPNTGYMEAFSADGLTFEQARFNLFRKLGERDRGMGWLLLFLRQS